MSANRQAFEFRQFKFKNFKKTIGSGAHQAKREEMWGTRTRGAASKRHFLIYPNEFLSRVSLSACAGFRL